jgi:hypothetical protein
MLLNFMNDEYRDQTEQDQKHYILEQHNRHFGARLDDVAQIEMDGAADDVPQKQRHHGDAEEEMKIA